MNWHHTGVNMKLKKRKLFVNCGGFGANPRDMTLGPFIEFELFRFSVLLLRDGLSVSYYVNDLCYSMKVNRYGVTTDMEAA